MNLVPKRAKLWLKARLGLRALHHLEWEQHYHAALAGKAVAPLVTDRRVCIVHDWMLRHAHFEAACREIGVPYSVLDLTTADWNTKVAADDSAVYFIRPFVLTSFGRSLYEDRAYFLTHVMRRKVFPDFRTLWIYESKRRSADLLAHHGIPAPRTWVFFHRAEALRFVDEVRFPLVFKTDIGSDAVGVRIVRSRRQARKIVECCFAEGFSTDAYDPEDRNRGQVLFQEYLPEAQEWRVIRMGSSYFAYQKGRDGDFHSGSKLTLFSNPPERLLEFVRRALDTIGSVSMAVDVFVTPSGRHLVNELHAYYGPTTPASPCYVNGERVSLPKDTDTEMLVDGVPGRYRYDGERWGFEPGDFARNAGCDLRLRLAFQQLGEPLPGWRA